MWLQRSRRGKDYGLWVDMLLIEGSGACGLGWIVKDCLSSVYMTVVVVVEVMEMVDKLVKEVGWRLMGFERWIPGGLLWVVRSMERVWGRLAGWLIETLCSA